MISKLKYILYIIDNSICGEWNMVIHKRQKHCMSYGWSVSEGSVRSIVNTNQSLIIDELKLSFKSHCAKGHLLYCTSQLIFVTR